MTEQAIHDRNDLDKPQAARSNTVIWVLLGAAFVAILNETVLSVALPPIMADLGITASTGQWLTTAFMLTMAVVIPITGFLLQRFNTRPVFIAAMSLFTAGTLTAAMAPQFGVLLLGRVVQASGTAIMMPLLMTTVLNLVPPTDRGRIMGRISIVMSVAPALGPTLSGLILSTFNWRAVFWFVLPIAVAALVFGGLRISNVTETKRVPVDVPSVLLSAVGFSGTIYGLSNLAQPEATGVPAWLALTVGLSVLAVFVWRQLRLQRADRALLDLRTFTFRTFTMAISLLTIAMIAMFGTFIVLPIYVQDVLFQEPVITGLLLLPGGLLMGLCGPLVGRLYDRIGPRPLVIPGTIIIALVFAGLSLLDENSPVGLVLVAHLSLSVGLALLFTPVFTAGLGSLPPRLYSHGSATVGTIQQVAGALGTAVFVLIMALRQTALAESGASEVHSLAGGIQWAFTFGAAVAAVAVVVSFFVRKPPVATAAEPAAEPAPETESAAATGSAPQ